MTGNAAESMLATGRTRNALAGRAYSHEALEACREVATGCSTARPIVLVGAPGSGKSRLLDALAHYIRACRPATRVVTISPESAPGCSESVLPPEGCSAILLVDRMECFDQESASLERVIRAFRNGKHVIVCASVAAPHLLPKLPAGLRRLLSDARSIGVSPVPMRGSSSPYSPGVDGVPHLAGEVARLHRVLTALRNEVGAARLVERELRAEIERERALTTAVSQAFDTAQSERRKERRQMYALHAELVRLQAVLDRKTRDTVTNGGSSEIADHGDAWSVLEAAKLAATDRARRAVNEIHTLRIENQQLREEADTLLARLWALAADLAASQTRLSDLERLRGAYAEQLTEVRERRLAAQDMAAAARRRAHELDAVLRATRAELDALRATPAVRAAPEPVRAVAPSASPAERRQLNSAEVDARTGNVIEALVSDKAAAEVKARRAETRLETAEIELVRARMEMDTLVEENERRLAALSTARARVASMERAFAQRETEWERWRAEGERARKAVQRLHEQMRAVVTQRDALQRRLEDTEAQRDALLSRHARMEGALTAAEARATRAEEERRKVQDALGTALAKQAALREEVISLHRVLGRMRAELDRTLHSSKQGRYGNVSPFRTQTRRPRVGEILVAAGALREGQLEEALRHQNGNGKRRIGVILVERGYTTEEAVSLAVARQAGVTFVRLGPGAVSANAVRLVSAEAARKHACIPLRATTRELTVAMADPLDQRARDEIARESRRRLHVLAAPKGDIIEAHQVHYAA